MKLGPSHEEDEHFSGRCPTCGQPCACVLMVRVLAVAAWLESLGVGEIDREDPAAIAQRLRAACERER